jgi:KTSC domain
MQRIPLNSSAIRSAGHDENNMLEIEFSGGSIVQYLDVPVDVYRELITSSSAGRYFASNIRDKFFTLGGEDRRPGPGKGARRRPRKPKVSPGSGANQPALVTSTRFPSIRVQRG